MDMEERIQCELDSFEHKLKGAIMYMGGCEPDFTNWTAHDLFETCIRNHINLCIKIDEPKDRMHGLF